eukprot:12264411-Alexandrium_andersonii.AAC.1
MRRITNPSWPDQGSRSTVQAPAFSLPCVHARSGGGLSGGGGGSGGFGVVALVSAVADAAVVVALLVSLSHRSSLVVRRSQIW